MKIPLLENTDGKGYNDEHTKVIEIRNSVGTLCQIEYSGIDFFLVESLLTKAVKKRG